MADNSAVNPSGSAELPETPPMATFVEACNLLGFEPCPNSENTWLNDSLTIDPGNSNIEDLSHFNVEDLSHFNVEDPGNSNIEDPDNPNIEGPSNSNIESPSNFNIGNPVVINMDPDITEIFSYGYIESQNTTLPKDWSLQYPQDGSSPSPPSRPSPPPQDTSPPLPQSRPYPFHQDASSENPQVSSSSLPQGGVFLSPQDLSNAFDLKIHSKCIKPKQYAELMCSLQNSTDMYTQKNTYHYNQNLNNGVGSNPNFQKDSGQSQNRVGQPSHHMSQPPYCPGQPTSYSGPPPYYPVQSAYYTGPPPYHPCQPTHYTGPTPYQSGQPSCHNYGSTPNSFYPQAHASFNHIGTNKYPRPTGLEQRLVQTPLPQNQLPGINTPGITMPDSLFIQEEPIDLHQNILQHPDPFFQIPGNNHYLDPGFRPDPPPSEANNHHRRHFKELRGNTDNFDASAQYPGNLGIPITWECHHPTFLYNKNGELSDLTYPTEKIVDYLHSHPLNRNEDGTPRGRDSRLILWIQTTPSNSKKRYPAKNSSKCRFAECPDKRNSIRKGFFRVALDEETGSGLKVDPYECAGFVHLYCLEKYCDFQNICQNLNVLSDNRRFEGEKNKMAVTRDHEEMLQVVRRYVADPPRNIPFVYEQSLCYQLTLKHKELEPNVRNTTRTNRGGNHIGLHMGNVDKYVEGEEKKWKERRLKPRTRTSPKRKRRDVEEGEDSNLEDEGNGQPRRIKRARR